MDRHCRRSFLHACCVGAAALARHRPARAEADLPSSLRILVGFAPGGPQDIVARTLAPGLAARLERPCIVENRAGASGNLAAEAVARAAPDGGTLLLCGPVNAINAAMFPALRFDFAKDVAPVAGIARVPLVLLVRPSVPADSVERLIEHARAKAGAMTIASAGNGTPQHVTGVLFQQRTGIRFAHVAYRGSAPALADLAAGHVETMFDALPSALPFIRAGRVRALAVTTSARASALPEVPCVSDTVAGFESSSWYGLGVPSATPAGTIRALHRAVTDAIADPAIVGRLGTSCASPMPASVQEFERFVAAETIKWRDVVAHAGIRPE